MIKRNQNYHGRPAAQTDLAALLRTYGSIGGANPRVFLHANGKASDGGKNGVPLILQRIYAANPVRNPTLVPAFEANASADVESMVDRIYQPTAKLIDLSGGKK